MLILIACAFLTQPPTPPTTATPPTLEPRTFRHSAGEYSAQIGRLKVPENRLNPKSRSIEIAFAWLKSTSSEPGPAIVYLAGGPGDAATDLVSSPAWAEFLTIADIILVDQRGVGRSRPTFDYAPPDLDPAPIFLTAESALAVELKAARLAREHFADADLSGYTTVQNAADIDDLRKALGLTKVSLMAHSYGTHLAQELARSFPSSIHRMVLIGTAGMDQMYALPADLDARLARLGAIVAADKAIGPDIPDLRALFDRVRAGVRKTPLRIKTAAGGPEIDVGEAGLRLVFLRDMGDAADIPILPRLLFDLDHGDTRLLTWFVQKRYAQMGRVPVLQWVMRGASGRNTDRWALIDAQAAASAFGKSRCWPPRELFGVLGIPDLGDAFRAPVRSAIPTLFISGTLDANTPPEQAESVRAGFSTSFHLIVQNGGHEDLPQHAPVRAAMRRFLESGQGQDRSIAAPPIRFVPLRGDTSGFDHPALKAIAG